MARENGYPTLKKSLREAGITGEEIKELCELKESDTVYNRINGRSGEWSLVDMMLIHQLVKSRTGVDWEVGELFDLNQDDRDEASSTVEATVNAWKYLSKRWDIDLHWCW